MLAKYAAEICLFALERKTAGLRFCFRADLRCLNSICFLFKSISNLHIVIFVMGSVANCLGIRWFWIQWLWIQNGQAARDHSLSCLFFRPNLVGSFCSCQNQPERRKFLCVKNFQKLNLNPTLHTRNSRHSNLDPIIIWSSRERHRHERRKFGRVVQRYFAQKPHTIPAQSWLGHVLRRRLPWRQTSLWEMAASNSRWPPRMKALCFPSFLLLAMAARQTAMTPSAHKVNSVMFSKNVTCQWHGTQTNSFTKPLHKSTLHCFWNVSILGLVH